MESLGAKAERESTKSLSSAEALSWCCQSSFCRNFCQVFKSFHACFCFLVNSWNFYLILSNEGTYFLCLENLISLQKLWNTIKHGKNAIFHPPSCLYTEICECTLLTKLTHWDRNFFYLSKCYSFKKKSSTVQSCRGMSLLQINDNNIYFKVVWYSLFSAYLRHQNKSFRW